MMKYESLAHAAIRVADLDRSLAFYARIGIPEMFRVHRDNGDLWLIYLRVTDSQYIEVFPNATGETAHDPMANGLNHFCLEVADLAATVRELEALGIPLSSPFKEGIDFNLQAWIKDPDGNRIELMQMSPKNLQFAAIKRMASEGRGA
jgi:lactoylglutathione lyase